MGMVFNNVNQKGGIHNNFIKFIIRDDEYEQAKIKKNLQTILQETSILFGTFSSDTLYAIPENQFNDLLVIFPDAGASKFRNPQYKSLFFFRPSTSEEVKALISYTINVLFKRKIAIFYEDSHWGIDGMKVAKKYIESLGTDKAECIASESYVRNTVNVQNAVEIIAKKHPEAVICIAHYRPTYSFIKHMLNYGQSKTSYLGVSETALIQEYLKKSRGINLISSSVIPSPWKSQLQIAQEYRQEMSQHLPNLQFSSISFEGYINAKLFVKALEKITTPITKEKIIKSLESFKNFNFKGLNISFDPTTRSLSKSVWINENKYTEWEVIANEKNKKNFN